MGSPVNKSNILRYLSENAGRDIWDTEIANTLEISTGQVSTTISTALRSATDGARNHIEIISRGHAWKWHRDGKISGTAAAPVAPPSTAPHVDAPVVPIDKPEPPKVERPKRTTRQKAEDAGLFAREPRTFVEEGTALDGRIMVMDASSPRDKFYLSEQ